MSLVRKREKGVSHLLPSVLLMGALACGAVAGGPIDVGSAEQLFLDDHMVATATGIVRRVRPAQKHPQPVITPGQGPGDAWEKGRNSIYGSVLRDPDSGMLRMWYLAGGNLALATSRDGIAWEKPALNLAVGKGGEGNAVMWRTPGWEAQSKDPKVQLEPGPFGHFYENYGVVFDPADPDPARRYKTAYVSIDHGYFGPEYHPNQKQTQGSKTKHWRRGMGTAVSADGIRWKVEQDFASYEIFDIGHLMWDPARKIFVVYGRVNLTPENDPEGRWKKWHVGRAVTRIESADFRSWSRGEIVMATDRQDPSESEIYSMSVFPYGDVSVGLVQMYYHIPGTLDIQLAVSRDGIHFTRAADRTPFIPEGPHGGWDEFNISVGDGPPLSMGENGEEMWFYHGGRNCRHPGHKMEPHQGPMIWSIGLAKAKRGRFLAVVAEPSGGTLTTKPLALRGKELLLNADARAGAITVTLLDAQGRPLPGYQATVRGVDAVAQPVRFSGGDLAALVEKPVAIRFDLAGGELFGFRVAP